MSGVAVALMEKPLFEKPPDPSGNLSASIWPAGVGDAYTEPFESLARGFGMSQIFVVQETEQRVIPSSRALHEALTLAKLIEARWFLCTHESTLGTTPSAVQHARALVEGAGAHLHFLVPSPWSGIPPSRSCAARLTEHLTWTGWSPTTLASILGLSDREFIGYLSGRMLPTEDQVQAWAAVLGLAPGWLSGSSPFPWWSDHVQELGWKIARAVCSTHGFDRDDRMRQVMRLAEAFSPLCRTQWFLPGLLGIDLLQYRRFMRNLSEADASMQERLCSALDLSLAWLDGRADGAHLLDSPHTEAIVYQIPLEDHNRWEAVL